MLPDQANSLIHDFLAASEAQSGGTPALAVGSEESLLREMEAAFRVQVAAAKPLPEVPGFSFGRFIKSSRTLSGDLAGLEVREDGTVAFWLADCSGKGLSAAMYGAMLQGLILGSGKQDPGDVMTSVNRALYAAGTSNMFATCVYGVLIHVRILCVARTRDPYSRL